MSYGNIYSTSWWGNTSSDWGSIYIALLSFLVEEIGGSASSISYDDIVAFNAQIVADGGQAIDVDALWAYVQSLPQSEEAENSVLAAADDIITPYGINGDETYSVTQRLSWGRIEGSPDVYQSSINADGEYVGYMANGARYSNSKLNEGTSWNRSGSATATWNSTQNAWHINQTTGNAALYPQIKYGSYFFGFSMEYKLISGSVLRNNNVVKWNLATRTVEEGADRVMDYSFTDLGDGWWRLDAMYDYGITNASIYNTWTGDAGTRADFYLRNFYADTTGQVMTSDSRPVNIASQSVVGQVQGVRTTHGLGYKAIVNEGLQTRKTNFHINSISTGSTEYPFQNSYKSYEYNVGTTTGYKRAIFGSMSSYMSNNYGRMSILMKDNGVDDYVFALGTKDGAQDWDYSGQDCWAAVYYNWTTGVWSNESNAEYPAEFFVEDLGNGWRRFSITSTSDIIAFGNNFTVWCLGTQSQTGNGGSVHIGERMFEQSSIPFGHPSVWFRGVGTRIKGAELFDLSEMKSADTDFTWVFDAIGDLRLTNGTDFEIDLSRDGLLKVNGVSTTATGTSSERNSKGESIVTIECIGGDWKVYVNTVEVLALSGQTPTWDAGILAIENKEGHSGQYKGIFTYSRALTVDEKADLIIE